MVKAGVASGFAKSEACNVAEGCGLGFVSEGGGGAHSRSEGESPSEASRLALYRFSGSFYLGF